MEAIGDEDLRLLASCLSGDIGLYEQVREECLRGTTSPDETAAGVAKFVLSHVDADQIEGVLRELRGATIMFSRAAATAPQLCLTMPTWLRRTMFASETASTEVAMVNVILHARTSLRLAFPFIDVASTEILRQLSYAWKRGCTVQVLCRDMSPFEALDIDAEFARALRECRKGAAYRSPVAVGNAKWTFHAKVLIADEIGAYVGSANLTKSSLMEQSEVGILIFEAAILKNLKAWYSSLWAALSSV
jgi:phosphatidylserine/phosphatidylglycerophosphate/cardiolipin synthase-like enzyme